jgi:hypothetical protein
VEAKILPVAMARRGEGETRRVVVFFSSLEKGKK